MSENSKCFCHLNVGGESYEVKDATAREAIKKLDNTVTGYNTKIIALENALTEGKPLKYATSQLNQLLIRNTGSTLNNFTATYKGSINIPSTVTPKLIILTIGVAHHDIYSNDIVAVVPIKEGETIQSMHTISPSNELECVETIYQNHTLYVNVHCNGSAIGTGEKVIKDFQMLCVVEG